MPRKSPFLILLTRAETEELTRRAQKYTLPYFIVVRAKMILLAAEDLSNDDIARRLNTRREVVSMWRKRFFEKRVAGSKPFVDEELHHLGYLVRAPTTSSSWPSRERTMRLFANSRYASARFSLPAVVCHEGMTTSSQN